MVAGGALGVAAWQRSNEVGAQRATSKEKAASLRGNATLSLDDACWLAKDWFHQGDGLARLPFRAASAIRASFVSKGLS